MSIVNFQRLIAQSLFLSLALLCSIDVACAQNEGEGTLATLDSGLLCDRLLKVGSQCYRTATSNRCVRSWAKEVAHKELIAMFQLDPSDARWPLSVSLFDGACQLACSLKNSEVGFYRADRFCRELGVRPGPRNHPFKK